MSFVESSEPDAPAAPPPDSNAPAYSVSELSFAMKKTLEDAYGFVRLRGEISKVTRHASGHIYLSLKDERACIDGVVWKGSVRSLKQQPQMGLEVIVTGRVTTYPARSSYQLVIEQMEAAGVGALLAQLERLKEKLRGEDLFEPERKRPLPASPAVIGVITSPTGAVIRDILHRIRDRWPAHVLVWPVVVQGDNAAAQVAAAIRGFNSIDGFRRPATAGRHHRRARRGLSGGPVAVQRRSARPHGGGQRHPADLGRGPRDRHHPDRLRLRSPGAHPDGGGGNGYPGAGRSEGGDAGLRAANDAVGPEAVRDAPGQIGRGAARTASAPEALVALPSQRFDLAAGRLSAALTRNVDAHERELIRTTGRFTPRLLQRPAGVKQDRLESLSSRLDSALTGRKLGADTARRARLPELGARLEAATRRRLERAADRLGALDQLRRSLNPEAPLARGYALVQRADGALVHAAAALKPGDAVRLKFADASLDARIGDGSDGAARSIRSAPRKAPPAGGQQGSLF